MTGIIGTAILSRRYNGFLSSLFFIYSVIFLCKRLLKAVIAIAKMILTCIYHLVQTGEPFNPSELFSIMHNNDFSQLTQRAGNYLVSRTDDKDFKWSDVKGKTIIGGRAGGMPQMILEYILKANGLDPKKDVEILTNLQFTTTAGAFVGGVGDYTMEFDPTALNIENEGKGYVISSCGVDSGYVPYTVYMATKEYIGKNPDTIQKFTNAIYKAQTWVVSHSAQEIAEVVSSHFPESDLDSLVKMIDRYNAQDTWKSNPVFEEEGFELLQDIMENGGELVKRVPYSEIVNTEYAKNAMK